MAVKPLELVRPQRVRAVGSLRTFHTVDERTGKRTRYVLLDPHVDPAHVIEQNWGRKKRLWNWQFPPSRTRTTHVTRLTDGTAVSWFVKRPDPSLAFVRVGFGQATATVVRQLASWEARNTLAIRSKVSAFERPVGIQYLPNGTRRVIFDGFELGPNQPKDEKEVFATAIEIQEAARSLNINPRDVHHYKNYVRRPDGTLAGVDAGFWENAEMTRRFKASIDNRKPPLPLRTRVSRWIKTRLTRQPTNQKPPETT
ncbi:Uncharacterised protein [uncultured archaeon]|nr:Uncharacterised protein [uncultured archaeon]